MKSVFDEGKGFENMNERPTKTEALEELGALQSMIEDEENVRDDLLQQLENNRARLKLLLARRDYLRPLVES